MTIRLAHLIAVAAIAAELAAIHTAVVQNRASMLPAAPGLHLVAAFPALLLQSGW